MSYHTAAWLAWSLYALSLVLTGLGLLFHILNLSQPSVPTFTYWVESTVMGVGASTVGAIIASRRTHNLIGWLLCVSGLVFGVVMFATEYAIYALLVAPGALPAGEALVSVNPLWVLGFNLFVLMLILFPTGHLPRSRWRWVVYLYVALALVEVVAMLFLPGTLKGNDLIKNPLGIEGLPIVRKPVQALIFTGGLVASGSLNMTRKRSEAARRWGSVSLANSVPRFSALAQLTLTAPRRQRCSSVAVIRGRAHQ